MQSTGTGDWQCRLDLCIEGDSLFSLHPSLVRYARPLISTYILETKANPISYINKSISPYNPENRMILSLTYQLHYPMNLSILLVIFFTTSKRDTSNLKESQSQLAKCLPKHSLTMELYKFLYHSVHVNFSGNLGILFPPTFLSMRSFYQWNSQDCS